MLSPVFADLVNWSSQPELDELPSSDSLGNRVRKCRRLIAAKQAFRSQLTINEVHWNHDASVLTHTQQCA